MLKSLPVIETKRLILREINEKDAQDMYEFASLPYVGPVAGWEPHRTLQDTKDVIRMYNHKRLYGQLGVFAVVLKENNKMIGTCELHSYQPRFKAELGYTINPEYWGNGFAVEASKGVINWGFTSLLLRRIECQCFKDNIQSIRVCEKLSLRYEGLRKNSYQLYNGEIFDLESYALTDAEYRELVRNYLW